MTYNPYISYHNTPLLLYDVSHRSRMVRIRRHRRRLFSGKRIPNRQLIPLALGVRTQRFWLPWSFSSRLKCNHCAVAESQEFVVHSETTVLRNMIWSATKRRLRWLHTLAIYKRQLLGFVVYIPRGLLNRRHLDSSLTQFNVSRQWVKARFF